MDHPTSALSSPFTHGALLYRTAGELTAAVVRFVTAGAERGDAVLLAGTGPNLRQLHARLDSMAEYVTWAALPAGEVNPGRVTAMLRAFAAANQGRPVRFAHEPAWPDCPPERLQEAIRQDALLNLALAGVPASVLCAYDLHLEPAALASAHCIHPRVSRAGRWQRSGSYTPGALFPAGSDQPLPAVPAAAAMLAYRDDQAAVRAFTAEQAARVGLPPGRATDLVIAVGELAANTFVHTSGPGTVSVWVTGGEVICQVADRGHIADPLAGSSRPDPVALAGGRGLWVVHQLCDLVEMRTGPAGTTFRLHMLLAPAAGGDGEDGGPPR